MKLAFEFVVALIVVAIGTALAAAVWNAAHDNGLVIEAFSVPPDLANRGLTGEGRRRQGARPPLGAAGPDPVQPRRLELRQQLGQ
ncbi:MAG: hypothetical protein WDM81_13190 [Rhizomicrobium sp.]